MRTRGTANHSIVSLCVPLGVESRHTLAAMFGQPIPAPQVDVAPPEASDERTHWARKSLKTQVNYLPRTGGGLGALAGCLIVRWWCQPFASLERHAQVRLKHFVALSIHRL